MATDTNSKSITATLPTGAQDAAKAANAKNGKSEPAKSAGGAGAIGQQEFLTLLITQLQNQDPLNPMDSQQFAVQLAQFTQVEQLVSLNQKFDNFANQTNSVGSMAQFLGKQVTLKDGPITIEKGKGPNLQIDVPNGTQSLRVQFLDAADKVVGQEVVDGGLSAGKQIFALDGVTVPDGEYTTRIQAVTSAGGFSEVKAKSVGVVEGFVLQPNPALLVGGQHVKVDSIEEVIGVVGSVGESEERS